MHPMCLRISSAPCASRAPPHQEVPSICRRFLGSIHSLFSAVRVVACYVGLSCSRFCTERSATVKALGADRLQPHFGFDPRQFRLWQVGSPTLQTDSKTPRLQVLDESDSECGLHSLERQSV